MRSNFLALLVAFDATTRGLCPVDGRSQPIVSEARWPAAPSTSTAVALQQWSSRTIARVHPGFYCMLNRSLRKFGAERYTTDATHRLGQTQT
jgi:hypothetical protein